MKRRNQEQQRIYSVEFLRIYLVLSVFLGHVGQVDTKLKDRVLTLLHSNDWRTWFAVEVFFVIGGFLLYQRIVRDGEAPPQVIYPPYSMFKQVSKLWMRLVPGFIFCYVLLVVVGIRHWGNLPLCLPPAGHGIGLNRSLISYGDWFVDVYFALSAFFISLFHISRRRAWYGFVL